MTRPTGVGQVIKTAFISTLANQGVHAHGNERHGTVQTPNGAQAPAELKTGVLKTNQLVKLAEGLAPSKLTSLDQELLASNAAYLFKPAEAMQLRSGERMAAQLRGNKAADSAGTDQVDAQTGQILDPNSVMECAASILVKSPPAGWNAEDIALTTWASYAVAGQISQEVSQSCAEHPDVLSHQSYTEIIDRTLHKAGFPLNSAQIGAQLRDLCLSNAFNGMADDDPELAELLYRVCAFFQPSELQMVALLQQTAQPGSTAELRREVIRELAADLTKDKANTQRALRPEDMPYGTASPIDTEAPKSGPSSGPNTTSTDEPIADSPLVQNRTGAFTAQWALATARWAIAAMAHFQRGSSTQSPGLSQRLKAAEAAINTAQADINTARAHVGVTAGCVNTIIATLPSVLRDGPLPEMVASLSHLAPMAEGLTQEACTKYNSAKEGLADARREIIMQRATQVLAHAKISRAMAANATSNAVDTVAELRTALSDHAQLVERAKSALTIAHNFLEPSQLKRARDSMQRAAELADEASRAAMQINLLAEKAHGSLDTAIGCTENASNDAKAAQGAADAQHSAVTTVLDAVASANAWRSDAQQNIVGIIQICDTDLENKRAELEAATRQRNQALKATTTISERLSSTQRVQRTLTSSPTNDAIIRRWTDEMARDRKALAQAQRRLSTQEGSLRIAEQRLDSAQQLKNQASAGARALASAAPSSDEALSAVGSLERLTRINKASADAVANAVSARRDDLAPWVTEMKTLGLKAQEILPEAASLSRDISVVLAELSDNPVASTAIKEATERAIDATKRLQELTQMQQARAGHIAEAIKSTAIDLAGPPDKKTIGDTPLPPAVVAGSAVVRAFRLANPKGAALDRLTQAQLGLSIVADAAVIMEWASHKDRMGPAFAKLLHDHDRQNYQQGAEHREKDSAKIETARLASHWLAQAGGAANLNYGLFNLVQGTCEIILGTPVAGTRRIVSGAVDLSNGVHQILANLPTTDGEASRWNQLKESVKESANNYPHWARVGSRATAAVAGAATVAMLHTNPYD